MWFDYAYGNLLKVDGFGNILVGMHGFKFLKTSEIEEIYPNKFLQLSESRVFVLNTLFNLPETHLLAHLIDFFDSHPNYTALEDKTGVRGGDVLMSYKSIFYDCRSALDWVHLEMMIIDGGVHSRGRQSISIDIIDFSVDVVQAP
ncbi:unnamed protein product [Heligmosomoides polygyrus]|uniref:Uncharacterized protein n=1 Tax=Heligmosomoides polygyrus TaxID=6339 RepID=A0A3P8B965_HELPZ|nr:unnamed protein product [Heligmosomoides polygyrus]